MNHLDDEKHLDLLAIFHYIFGGLLALFSCFPLIHVLMGLIMVNEQFQDSQGQGPPPAFGWIFVIVGAVFILAGWCIAACIIVAGRKLQTRRHRMYCMIVAGVACIYMPLGTALGIFTLVVLCRDSMKGIFDQPAMPPAV